MKENDKDDPKVPKQGIGDFVHAGIKATISLMPVPIVAPIASELLSLVIRTPLEKRRDEWMDSVARRLATAEADIEALSADPGFVTVIVQATVVAQRTHRQEKLEALKNAVVNAALGRSPDDDLRELFLNLVDTFTPMHLRLLTLFRDRSTMDATTFQRYREQKSVTDLIVNQLIQNGLIEDQRPYAARGRDSGEALVCYSWPLTNLGAEFLAFIS